MLRIACTSVAASAPTPIIIAKRLANVLIKKNMSKLNSTNMNVPTFRFYQFGTKEFSTVGGNISTHGSIPGLQISSSESYSERLRTPLLSVSI